MAADIQYKHAIEDNSDRVVNISSLTKENRSGHKYYCPDCHNEMYPTFGKKYEHHFRHLGDVCQKNNYLHATAEYMFLEEYKKCLEKGAPFLLELHSRVKCDRNCTERKNRLCLTYKNKTVVDLTKIYTNIQCEHRVQVEEHYRRPDILLTSDDGEQLWIEIWVTHETIAEKREDGHIIELKITTEKDLEQIKNHKLVKTVDNELAVRLFNVDFHDEGIVEQENVTPENCTSFRATINRYASFSRPSSKPVKHTSIMANIETEPFEETSMEWIDLGLPSGTLWASYDFGTSVAFNTAYYGYRKHLPSKSDTEELRNNCTKEWLPETHTLKLIGPNGNSIYFRIIDKHISYWLNLYEEWNDLGQCFHLFQDKSFYINDMPCSNPGKLRFVKRISKQELKEKTEPSLFDTIDN